MARRGLIMRGRQGRAPRRETQWGSFVSTAPQNVPANSDLLFSRFTAAILAANTGTPLTVVRVRGMFYVETDQIAASEDQLGAVGIAVVSEQAAVAGVASIPSPVANADWDGWLYWQPILQGNVFLTGAGFSNRTGFQYVIDNKAMRKIEDNESLVTVVGNSHATAGFDITFAKRTLFKLH